jgi:predicted dehydrogenase
MSIHHFDLIRAVLGQEVTAISCHTWNPNWSLYVDPPAGDATVMLEQGAVVSYRGSWVSPGPQTNWGGEWRIECAQGEITWSTRGTIPDYVTIRPLGQEQAEPIALPEVPFIDRKGSLHAFVEAVNTGRQPESNGFDNFNTLALTLASVASSQQGGALIKPERYTSDKE